MQETQVRFLGQEDPLEKGMATHSSVLAWRIPRTEEPGGLQSVGSQRVRHDGSNLSCSHAEQELQNCFAAFKDKLGSKLTQRQLVGPWCFKLPHSVPPPWN